MLRCVMTDIGGQEHIMLPPLKIRLRMEEGVPADSVDAVFPYTATPELRDICIYDGSRAVFIGVVDEQTHIIDPSGEKLAVSGRSLAAHLLDNEAMPRSYDHPSAMFIYEHHVYPYGIAKGDSDDSTLLGEQVITKGTSQWGVLRNFCNACYSAEPRVSADGVLYMKGVCGTDTTVFSDSGDGIAYTSLQENIRRCEELSAVNVKVSNADGYTLPVQNTDAIDRGITRERYINAVLTSSPMKCADTMIENSRAKAYSLTLNCPTRLSGILGNGAIVRSRAAGDKDNLYVSAVKYTLDQNGENTEVTLKRRYTRCG